MGDSSWLSRRMVRRANEPLFALEARKGVISYLHLQKSDAQPPPQHIAQKVFIKFLFAIRASIYYCIIMLNNAQHV